MLSYVRLREIAGVPNISIAVGFTGIRIDALASRKSSILLNALFFWRYFARLRGLSGGLFDVRVTREHAGGMSKMVQIRNLMAELERLAARPTREEMRARLHGRKRVVLKTPAAVLIRGQRESA